MSRTEPTSLQTRKELACLLVELVREGRLDQVLAAGFLKELTSAPRPAQDDIAIIGIGCRFPFADSPDAFWRNLSSGRNCIRPFPAARRAHLAAQDQGRTALFHGGFLDAVDGFDHEYFQIPPRVAEHMDPYQRLMLQTLVETIEHAGYHRGALYGKPVGVFVGTDHTHRLFNNYVAFIDEVDFHSVTGSWTAVLASRLSYLFNFKGPATVVDTACSSGLVALDSAIKALRDGDCEVALVAAANLFFAPGKGLVGEIENDTFEVRAFDAGASGTAWGEGLAAVMVKPLAQALRDGDPLHAVVRGIALNNDGATNGLTAPNAKAQRDVILKAWARARLNPEALDYIETHGTGTQLGDPIEIKGLAGAFERHGRFRQHCAIGSVKTNIGHTVGTAGLASLIKVVLSLHHEHIPPSLHFGEPSRYIDFCNSPVYLNDRLQPWPRGARVRVAGVSSFSLSGTNCHLVVQEPPLLQPAPDRRPRLVALSARTPALFAEQLRRLLRHLAAEPQTDLASLAHTLATGREQHALRAAVVAGDVAELVERLQQLLQRVDVGAETQAPAEPGLWWRLDAAPAAADAGLRLQRDAAIDRARGGDASALAELATLYVAGLSLPWEALYRGEGLRRISLPPQPFALQRFWSTPAAAVPATDAAPPPQGMPERAALLAAVAGSASRLSGEQGLADPLAGRVVAHLWSELMGYPRIAASDDFHALGGDSITAMKIVHVLGAAFGLALSPADLLGRPMLAEFVQWLLDAHGFGALLHGEAPAAPQAIAPLPPAASHALSRAQRRMLALSQISEGSTVYNVSALVRLAQRPDPVATERIVGAIIARHEVLRTALREIDGEYRQVVLAQLPFALEVQALAPVADAQAELAAVQAAMQRFIRPFDLAAPPLLRVGLLQVAGASHYLAIDMHHIVTDGSSMGVLVGEFARLAAGEVLPALPFQYRDVAAWQNQHADSAARQAQAAFWQARFADGVPVLELATDFPRPAVPDHRGAKLHLLLPAQLRDTLRALARAQGCTLFVVLLAAFKALLYKLGGGRDIVVGSPVSGRDSLALHGLIGLFVNTLALRDRIEPQDSFLDLLQRVRANTLQAMRHQDYPYEELVESLQLPRNVSRNPLFDVCFSLQNEDIGLASPDVQPVPLPGSTAKFDMTVMLRDTGAGLAVDWEYAVALYHPDSIARYAACWQRLLEAVAAAPQAPLRTLTLLDAGERARLLDYNATASRDGGERGIPALFEDQARARPDAVALQMGERSMRYGALDAAANRLAHWLLGQGVRRGDSVALFHERGPEMVIAILAVLKAGAAYLPLDVDSPAERLAGIVEDARPRLVLAGIAPPVEAVTWAATLALQADIALDGLPDEAPPVALDGDAIAYVMFTSGSTGRPKGVRVRHRSVVRVVCCTNYLHLGPEDACLLVASYAFDGSVPDLFGALLNGGRLVLIAKHQVLDFGALADAIRQHRISSFFITTSLFNALVDADPHCLRGVRNVIFGGEAASPRHVARALAVTGPGRLINGYGPTETTVFALAHVVHALAPGAAAVPIGRPLTNTSVYVVDEDLGLVPHGVVGELVIGGDGVAAGYLQRPELTAERFVPDPFVPGGRLYRSGDLVKWLADGTLAFVGRRDQQIKVRGFRIEPGEVEAVLGRHPEVQECLVTAQRDAGGQWQLCAYVVAPGAAPGLPERLRAFLAGRLPEYMLPAAMVWLPAFARNANGKLDRQALPAPQPRAVDVGGAPRDVREDALAQAWAEVLALPQRPGIHDNFFSLGGDSIKAIRVVTALRALGWTTQVALLFQRQSIAELAPQLIPAAAQQAVAPPPAGIAQRELDDIFSDLEIV